MKIKIILLTIITITAISVSFFDLTAAPQTYKEKDSETNFKAGPLPVFEIRNLQNKNLDISKIEEDTIIINFWASWCEPCRREFPALLKMVKNNKGKIALLTISIDDEKKDVLRFLKMLKINQKTPHTYWAWDEKKEIAFDVFNIVRVPETIIVDKKRNMVRKVVGDFDWEGFEVKDIK